MTTQRSFDSTLPTAPHGRATRIDRIMCSRMPAAPLQRFVVATQSLA